jgi:hypothetical protein
VLTDFGRGRCPTFAAFSSAQLDPRRGWFGPAERQSARPSSAATAAAKPFTLSPSTGKAACHFLSSWFRAVLGRHDFGQPCEAVRAEVDIRLFRLGRAARGIQRRYARAPPDIAASPDRPTCRGTHDSASGSPAPPTTLSHRPGGVAHVAEDRDCPFIRPVVNDQIEDVEVTASRDGLGERATLDAYPTVDPVLLNNPPSSWL